MAAHTQKPTKKEMLGEPAWGNHNMHSCADQANSIGILEGSKRRWIAKCGSSAAHGGRDCAGKISKGQRALNLLSAYPCVQKTCVKAVTRSDSVDHRCRL